MKDTFRPFYPFDSHWFDRAGLRLHYLDEGEGSPVIMLHGNPSWSFYYRNAVLALRDTYRCIVPDHIGMGLSDKPDDSRYDYTLQSRVDDLDALIASLDLPEKVTLMLHDWGGMIGMAWALRHPQRIQRLVILNTAAFRLLPGKRLPWLLTLNRQTLLGAYLNRGLNIFARGATLPGLGVARPLPAGIAGALCAPYDNWENRIAVLRFVQDIPLQPTDRAYPIVRASEEALEAGLFRDVPAIIFWGMRDFVFDRDYLRRWEQFLPQAELHRYTNAGHYVLEDAPRRILPALRGWLDRTGSHHERLP